MTVGVVTDKVAVVQPDDTVSPQPQFQLFLDFLDCKGLVTVRSQQALGGGENRALAVAFHRTALQHEVFMIFEGHLEEATLSQMAGDGIVKLGREFLTPSVETEIEEEWGGGSVFSVYECQRGMVAGPGVVGGAFKEGHL